MTGPFLSVSIQGTAYAISRVVSVLEVTTPSKASDHNLTVSLIPINKNGLEDSRYGASISVHVRNEYRPPSSSLAVLPNGAAGAVHVSLDEGDAS